MPFQEMSRMQGRRRLAYRVLEEGVNVSAAAREMGVSRATAHLWVERARTDGIAELCERSRRPESSPFETPASVQAAVLECKALHPAWGAKKIHAVLWPDGTAPICVRTVDRLLSRHGLIRERVAAPVATGRFQRERCNELWQLDYKGVPRSYPYAPLSVVDDCSRYLLLLSPLRGKSIPGVLAALWDLFGEVGLPESILSDNGDGFNDWQAKGPTLFEAALWRLGIATRHGRVRHPQTQGKVERFHRTLNEELMSVLLLAEDEEQASRVCATYRAEYNWKRPHEAIGLRVPGSAYVKSARKRPDRWPEPELPVEAIARKVDAYGKATYRGQGFRPGRGLAGQYVEIREQDQDTHAFYAGVRIGSLAELHL